MKKTNYKTTFIGAFNLNTDNNVATSAAGNQVQAEIIKELSNTSRCYSKETTQSIILNPIRSWPYGPWIFRGHQTTETYMPPFINISGLKYLIFSIFAISKLIRTRPDIIVKYNLSLPEAIALLVYRIINPSTFLVAVIQDVHFSKSRVKNIKQLFEFLAIRLASSYDFLIPISRKISEDFKFPTLRTRIFNGGLTRQGRDLLAESGTNITQYAVFAGALVPYNGIDVLVKKWISENIELELHIFGKGSLEAFIRDAASKNSKIIFHGFKPEDEVSNWQKKALINFCLRYSEGIDAGYFFPSKLFNIICAPGVVLVNRFESFPSELQNGCLILNDDLSDLSEKVRTSKNSSELVTMRTSRREWIENNGNWASVIREIHDRATNTKKFF